MMINRRKHASTFRLLLMVSVTMGTVLVLLLGTKTLSLPGFSSLSLAHAKDTVVHAQTLCVSHPSDQNCTNQDPMVQGCDTDAHTLVSAEIRDQQGTLLATVERRYSAACHSAWGRIREAGQGKQPLNIIIGLNSHPTDFSRSAPGNVVYSMMAFLPNLSIAPEIIGSVSTNGIDPAKTQAHSVGIVLQELPTVG